MQEIPSLLVVVPPELAFAAAKAIRDFLDASMAKFTSCACEIAIVEILKVIFSLKK